jgi:uncharacterized protein (TIGR03437 family)
VKALPENLEGIVERTPSVFVKLIVASCLCLGAASGLVAQTINVSISGTLGPIIPGGACPGTKCDPLGLNGSSFTAVTNIPALGAPVNPGSTHTYTGLSLTLTALGIPLTCPAASATVTAGSNPSIVVGNCNLPLGSTFTATVNLTPNSLISPIPIPFSAGIVAGSQGTYTVEGEATTLGISGSVDATCSGCVSLALNPASVTLAGQTGGSAVSQSVSFNPSSPPLSYAVVTSSTSWLSVNVPGGSTGTPFTVTATPGSLGAGSYSGSVSIYTAASNSPVILPVTFNVSSPSFNLVASPNPMTFNSVTGGAAPSQSLAVTTNPASSIPYTAAASSSGWLSLNTTSGTTGGTPLSVSVNSAGLAAGSYSGSITLTASGATNSPLVVQVTLNVTTVSVSPTSLGFNFTAGGPAPGAQSLGLSSSPGSVSYTASATSTGNWLAVTPTSGSTPATLSVTVNTTGLAANTYNGTINITPAGATTPIAVPVTLTVASAPSMVPTPASLSFSSSGGAVPASQALGLASSVPAIPISYTVAATTASGGSWLTVSPGSGTTPGSETVSINSSVLTGLATGVYTGNVVFTATTNASPTTLSVPVTLTVTAALKAVPASLTFNYTVAGAAPVAQAVAVTSNAGAITYTATATTTNGGNWLAVTPGSATTPTGVSVSVIPGSLTAGTYTGSVTLASTGASNNPLVIPVTFVVAAEPTLTVLPTSLTFNLTSNGSLPAAQNLAISASNSAAFPFTAAASTTTGGSWLAVSSLSGSTPANLGVSVTLNNLAPGIYAGSVKLTVASGIANSPVTIPVQLNVTAAPTLSASPASLAFAYTLLSGTTPSSQTTSITASGGVAIPFTAAVATGGSWLSVTPGSGTTPASLTVSVNPAGLTAGVYSGSISLTSPQAAGPQSIPVTFTVTAAPTLSTSVASLTYEFQIGGSNPAPQSFTVSSSGAALSFTAAASSTGNWLSVVSSGGSTPATVTASVNASALTAGTYNGSITITSAGASNNPVVIPVTLTVSSQPLLNAAPSSLTFNYTIGGSVPVAQTVNLTSTGTALNFTASTATPWLKVSQSGSTTPGSLSVSVNIASLAAGTYSGTITVTAAGASNSPLSYGVTLIVAGQPTLSVGPPSLTFGGQVGGANPASQSIQVASTAGSLSFTASATSTGNWLSVSPTSGTTNPAATLTVSVNTAGMLAGTYNGTITIAAPGASNPSVSVPVTLTLGSNALTVGPTTMSFAYQIAGTAPAAQTLTVGSTSTALSFTAASGASWLSVTPTSGTTLTTLSVSVLTAGLTPGTYTSAVTITATGAANSPLKVPVTFTVTAQPAIVAAPGTLAFSYQTGGTAPVSQNLAISSSNTPFSFTAAAGASWLSVLPTSGTTPASLGVSVNTAGLTPGTYTSAVTITAPGASNSPLTVPVTFTITAQAGILATPGTVSFSYAIGAATPAVQSVALSTSNGAAASFSAIATTTSASKWLAVSPASGSTPASLAISVNPAGLAAGTYVGSIAISASGFTSQTVSVTLTVTPASQTGIVITGNPSFTVFNTKVPATTTLGISISGGAALPYTVAAVGAQPAWFTFTPTSGTTPGNLTLTANAAGLYPGTYLATLLVTASGTPQLTKTISVELTVAGSNLVANPATLSFAAPSGGPVPAAQSLTISPAAGTAAPLPLGAITTTALWLRVTPATSAPATVQVSVSLSQLTPGTYNASIYVSALGSTGPSLVIPVTLTVGALPQLTATPSTLAFGYTPGGTLPAAQSFALASGGVPLNFTVTSPGAWLTVEPLRGTTPGTVVVTANPAGLGAGTYSGTITASAYGAANSVPIPVTLTVSGPGQLEVTPAQLSFASPVGGPAPASQTVSVGAVSAIAFTASASSNAKWLSVTPAAGTTPASLSISVNPTGLLAGTYLAGITVTPISGSGTPVTVMVTFKVGSGTGTGTPTISSVQNAASGVAGTVSPGLWVSIFGNSLGPVTGVSFVTPPTGETVATTLANTQVLFDGTAVPLLYVSDAQVNALVPFELVGKTSTVMQVVSNDQVSASVTLPVVAAQPGLFTSNGSGKGEGAILNQDSSVNSASNPAAQGSIIVLYGTGGGQTNPASIDGGFNPLNAEGILLLPVTVTIGGQPAQVEYSGPAPGLVDGVMQINATLPSGIASGAVPVVVTVGTASSQTAVTVAVQ